MTTLKTKFIGTNQVTYAKLQQASTVTLLGNPTGGTANVEEITLGTGLSFSGTSLTATGTSPVGNVAANDSNVTFTSSSNRTQICTPTAARTYTLPTTSIVAGDIWTFVNTSTTVANVITIQSSGSNTIDYVIPNGKLILTALVNTPTTAANWLVITADSATVSYIPTFTGMGTVSNVGTLVRRDRNFLYMSTFLTGGTSTATAASMTIPFGALISTSPVNANFGGDGAISGHWSCQDTNESGNVVTATGASQSLVYFGKNYSSANSLTSQNGSSLFTPNNNQSFEVRVAISNWS